MTRHRERARQHVGRPARRGAERVQTHVLEADSAALVDLAADPERRVAIAADLEALDDPVGRRANDGGTAAMRVAITPAQPPISVCRRWAWGQAHVPAGGAQRKGRREGKIKADGTPWGPSGGQALVCTLFGATLPRKGRSAAPSDNARNFRELHGTLAQYRRPRRDRRS